jgi:sulfoxide reductase catalytic subunit YedY
MDKCELLPKARFLVFHTLDEKWERPGHGYYYEVIDLEIARLSQTILAYEMNGQPLPVPHGAPLRLRVENQLGYKWPNGSTALSLSIHLSISARDKAGGATMSFIIILPTPAFETDA